MNVGDRVINIHTGEVGYIEEIEDNFAGMRCLTPDNVPSCCVSWSRLIDFKRIPSKVIPLPRSAEWKRESKMFCDAITQIIKELDL